MEWDRAIITNIVRKKLYTENLNESFVVSNIKSTKRRDVLRAWYVYYTHALT